MKNSAAPLATADLFLAMAHHRAGRRTEGQAALDRALKRMETEVPRAGVEDPSEVDVENWLICQVARREAEALFAGR